MMYERIIKRLTDAYNKNPDSNIAKVLRIVMEEIDEINDTLYKIEVWDSVDKAKGAVLDDLGRDVDQPRGQATDEIYRVLIKSKVARDLSTGDTNTIINVLSMALNAEPSEIGIYESWLDPEEPEPASITLMEIPIRRLIEVGMSGRQFARIVSKTLAAGVGVKRIDLQGTFEYGGDTLETDYDKGFANIDQTVGGYYGTLYQSENDPYLPLG